MYKSMYRFLYLVFACGISVAQATDAYDEKTSQAIEILKTTQCPERFPGQEFPNPTTLNTRRSQAAVTLTHFYQEQRKRFPQKSDVLAQQLLHLARPQKEGGLLINFDYEKGTIPVTIGIVLGETFERLDLAESLMIGAGVWGLTELLRGYAKHWEKCPCRAIHGYQPHWEGSPKEAHYACCFRIISLFKKHYNAHELSLHQHFIASSLMLCEQRFTNNGFPEALGEIRKALQGNPHLKSELQDS